MTREPRTQYGVEIAKLEEELGKDNPNFGEIIKRHKEILNKYYVVKKKSALDFGNDGETAENGENGA